MASEFTRELANNFNGYVLLVAGVALFFLGAHSKIDKLTETGTGLTAAALLAFQRRDSNLPQNPTPPAAQ